ncbi:hypothetical protein NBRC116588_28640 [Pyruvatibacter sp. HU-CL02332]|uniref:PAS domain-containing protein n=1 Tax=Pyruvatibacter sp. HU-CL02332 TaxID=3127650 RepID=UPI0031041E9E
MPDGKSKSDKSRSTPALIKPVDALEQAQTRCALAFWQSNGSKGSLPPTNLIDPSELRELLPNIVLIDVIWPDGTLDDAAVPQDFRYRLIGGHSAETHDANLTGTLVSDLSRFGESYSEVMMGFYRSICAQKAPVAAGGTLAIIGKGYRDFEAIYLPFTETGNRVDRLMAAVVYL